MRRAGVAAQHQLGVRDQRGEPENVRLSSENGGRRKSGQLAAAVDAGGGDDSVEAAARLVDDRPDRVLGGPGVGEVDHAMRNAGCRFLTVEHESCAAAVRDRRAHRRAETRRAAAHQHRSQIPFHRISHARTPLVADTNADVDLP